MDFASPETIQRILKECRTIAVVGLSSNPVRPSYGVAGYMKQQGYRVIPINPHEINVLGEQAYPSLAAVPDKVDLVDVFRRSEEAGAVVDEAIRIGALAVVEPKRLFIKVAKQVERLNGNIGAANGSLEKRPEVFDSVCMHVAAHVGFSVIDYVMDIIFIQAIVRAKRIAIHGRTSLNVLANFAMKRAALS